MARHRAIRNAKSYEYDDYDDFGYGQSYEDDYCVSPGTLAQYSYRQADVGLSHFIPSESTVQEEYEPEDTAQSHSTPFSDYKSENGHMENSTLFNQRFEQIRDVVGESCSVESITDALRNCDYDVEKSINYLLSSPDLRIVSQSDIRTTCNNEPVFMFPADKPLEQRKPKLRARDQNFNKNSTQATNSKLTAQPKREITMIKTTNKTPVKTGFDTLSNNKNNTNKERTTKLTTDLFNLQVDKPYAANAQLSSLSTGNYLPTPGKTATNKSSAQSVEEYKLTKHASDISAKHKEYQHNSKPQISLVVIGHVDAGKSTLMGHILYKCGEVSKKTMHKYEKDSKKLGKSSFAYAWVLDETEEERNRGVTMDVGLTKFETEHRNVILLDAPGHKDFIPNMISGASQADVALLVINSTTGEFEAGFDLGGQTREHSLLVRSLGVSQLAVAINKLDTVDWSEERFKDIVKKLQTFLKQAGFKENEVTYVPVSGLLGENLTSKSTNSSLRGWYKGPCLLDVIDGFKAPSRPIDLPMRLCVTDVFKGQGTGIQVSGKLETGGISVGDKAIILPAGETTLIKGIEFQDGSKRDIAFAGDHITLSCHGVDIMKVQTGNIISSIQSQINVVTKFQARIIVFNTDLPITKGFSVELLYKAASEPAVIRKLINVLHKTTGEIQTKRPKMLLKGQNATVSLEVFRPICIEEYSKIKELGRFTLRYGGTTIAAGVVTKLTISN